MKCRLLAVAIALPLASAAAQSKPTAAAAAQQQAGMTMTEFDGRATQWGDISVPGFAPGLKIAVLAGNPDKAGDAYTLRLRFPDGYSFPAHWHPNAENLTVVSGTFYLGMGSKAVAGAAKRHVAGDFLFIPGHMPHFGEVRGETVVQLHGTGPFQIMLAGTP
jgi:quercetin dioxygenase-like cupin family protein